MARYRQPIRRRRNRNQVNPLQNVKPYRSFNELSADDQQFINNYVSANGGEQNNLDLAKRANKDELWYHIWHKQHDQPQVNPTPAQVTLPEQIVPSTQNLAEIFDPYKDQLEYQKKYYDSHNSFDYLPSKFPFFTKYGGIGDFMSKYNWSPDTMYNNISSYLKK